jgi:hypothetical protein
MKKFLISLKVGSNTETQDFYADNYQDILDFFSMSAVEILEISEYIYESDLKIEDDGNYIKSVKFNGYGNQGSFSLRLPKIKTNKTEKELSDLVKSSVYHRGKSLNELKVTITI